MRHHTKNKYLGVILSINKQIAKVLSVLKAISKLQTKMLLAKGSIIEAILKVKSKVKTRARVNMQV